MEHNKILRARALFPSGLEQPEGSFRFGSDAILLGNFTAAQNLPEKASIAELGTGCGAAAMALLLQKETVMAVGVEIQPALVQAARSNAEHLGLSKRIYLLEGDIRCRHHLIEARRMLASLTDAPHTEPEPPVPSPEAHPSGPPLFDAVMCNPPWRIPGTGKISPSSMRETALAGTSGTFADFFSAADALLKHRGILIAICSAARLPDVLSALPHRLNPEHLRLVFTRPGRPAASILLTARKNGRAPLTIDKMEL